MPPTMPRRTAPLQQRGARSTKDRCTSRRQPAELDTATEHLCFQATFGPARPHSFRTLLSDGDAPTGDFERVAHAGFQQAKLKTRLTVRHQTELTEGNRE